MIIMLNKNIKQLHKNLVAGYLSNLRWEKELPDIRPKAPEGRVPQI